MYNALRVVESRAGCRDYYRASLVSKVIIGASVVVKLPVYKRAWFVSDVITRVSLVALELLRTASGGTRQLDGINTKDTKVKLVGYGENQGKPRVAFSVYVANGYTIM